MIEVWAQISANWDLISWEKIFFKFQHTKQKNSLKFQNLNMKILKKLGIFI